MASVAVVVSDLMFQARIVEAVRAAGAEPIDADAPDSLVRALTLAPAAAVVRFKNLRREIPLVLCMACSLPKVHGAAEVGPRAPPRMIGTGRSRCNSRPGTFRDLRNLIRPEGV